ncbi:PEPxxWA-CTERM sorting domain-containing protein [Rugamonas sp. FT107W]|uniref:PEPxxWA-CTERM sorting domain-containing protein n=1 Tax=Duganella vulcania TaxID=2692166 RepID=A0A845HMQ4_9BURK|nr:PEP-CTERM sorting domain-containing protein [Duganella vulcania]MYN18785.1 PEPxxWA-CTERM sorting domain-containing protein [Duganella vulcania]
MKKMHLKHSLLVCSILLACAGQATATSYSLTIFAPPPDGVAVEATSINNAGVVSGNIFGSDYLSPSAVTWSGGSATYLDKAGGAFSGAEKINDQGTVIGSITSIVHDNRGNVPVTTPAIWNNGVATTLPGLGQDRDFYPTRATGLNNAGVVVGVSGFGPGGRGGHAVKWVNGVATDLGAAGGSESYANAINDNGQIVGSAKTQSGYDKAVLWENGTAIDLAVQAGVSSSLAMDINNAGVVVGRQTSGEVSSYNHATIWHNGVATQLDFAYGDSDALAINNVGDVVGYAPGDYDFPHGVLWKNGEMIDLNNYLDASLRADGWILVSATDINDRGDIVGELYKSGTNIEVGYLLAVSAVPEPSTYAMMLSGFGLLAFAARRRRGPQS